MKRFLLILLFFAFISIFSNKAKAGDIDYGLYIKSYPSNDQEKTSLILENNEPIKLSKETTLSFDMFVRQDNVFGVVFRIITDKKENIDLMFTVGENNKRYPILVINESVHMIQQEITCNEWIKVSITLSSKNNDISLSYGAAKLTVPYRISNAGNAKIAFGLCPFPNYSLYDIASVNIKNIRVYENKDLFRYWKLERYEENISKDSIAHVPAIAINPQWMIDMYASWKKVYTRKIQDNSLFAFNPEQNKIYIASSDSKQIIVFDTAQNKDSVIQVREGIIAANAPNQLFYNMDNKQLISYNLDENIFSTFSFENSSWGNKTKSTLEHGYWNNSVSYSPADSMLVCFGGYGFYKYNNDLIRINPYNKILKKSNLPEIEPRYSSSTAVIDNILYIFGGRGSKSGRQELYPRNYYDFYSVNLLTEQVNKLWEIEGLNLDFLPGENLIFDEKENCFYVFTTKEGGTLFRLWKEPKGMERLSFPIEEDLTAHYLYTNLYFSPSQKKFYAIVNKTKVDKSSEVTIYSLNYPPIPLGSLVPTEEKAEVTETAYIRYIIIIAALTCLGIIIAYFFRKKKRQDYEPIEDTSFNHFPQQRGAEDKPKVAEQVFYDFSKQSICFLGGFTVIDKTGENITGQFTPMLKHLLLLLILSTEKDGKGISGKKLIQLLWFEKNEEAAKNNRNVYLSKLRTVLEKVGDIEILNQNGFWSIKFDEHVTCDYMEVMHLLFKIKESQHYDQTEVDKVLELLLRGVLLPNTEEDWVDNFKSDFSNLTIDILTELLQNEEHEANDELKFKIADTLFLHDYINEEALYLKCSILFNSGKKGIAKGIYDNFCKEYFNLLGVKYKYSLSDVVNKKTN